MPIIRRFLIAPSLTRLIRKECGSERVSEGYFAPQSERQSRVRIETAQSCLILTSTDAASAEERTDLPRLHAEALLDVSTGKVTFERSALRLQGEEALVDRFVTPGPLDLVAVEFTDKAQAAAFLPPAWFGVEVTDDDGYSNNALALSGLPSAAETPLSDAALDALLDALEGRPGRAAASESGRKAESASEAESTFDMLRRLAVVPPANSAAKAPDENGRAHDGGAGRVTEPKSRRPVRLAPLEEDADGDERLAGVIEGLSEALSQSPGEAEEQSEADLRGRPAWRWSAH